MHMRRRMQQQQLKLGQLPGTINWAKEKRADKITWCRSLDCLGLGKFLHGGDLQSKWGVMGNAYGLFADCRPLVC